jgi:hypothetical protein
VYELFAEGGKRRSAEDGKRRGMGAVYMGYQ